MKERIQKVLAAAGVASRRAIEEMVMAGRVSVNGRIMTDLPIMIDPTKDKVDIDGDHVKLASKGEKGPVGGPRVYLLMNKPKGVHSTNVAQGEQVRAIDLLPPNFRHRVYPVGRLDADSKGLLLLTNDGDLTNQLTHPRYGVAKTYRAVVDGRITQEDVDRLQSGIWLADRGKGGFKTGRSRIHVAKRLRDKSVLEITIREGRNRQVRRMLASAGHKVRELTRVKMGPLTLHNLPVGAVRTLTARELKELRKVPERGEAKETMASNENASGDWSLKRPVRGKSQRPSR